MLIEATPRVTLRNWFRNTFDDAVAAARTCYSPRVIGADEITESQRETIGALTFDAGHHTVFQHATFEFGLEDVSRQFVWSFLHSFPFYNSEQQSQRYVKLKEPRVVALPLEGRAREIYRAAVVGAWDAYAALTEILREDTWRILAEIWRWTPAKAALTKRLKKEADKKAIETARYVIPLGCTTAMVYTVSGIVLHRLRRMMHTGDCPAETRAVVGAMVAAVEAVEPDFFRRIGQAAEAGEISVEEDLARTWKRGHDESWIKAFDDSLEGRRSRLVDWSARGEEVTADAVRHVLGLSRETMDDDAAIAAALDPAQNRYRLETMNVAFHSPLARALHHASYTFRKRLSHTADSQDQRHRMVPASRPLLTLGDTRAPDVVVPDLIAANPRAKQVFDDAVGALWEAKRAMLAAGAPIEHALYVLPNAKTVRMEETGSLLYLLHKWQMRTCFNAQREIFDHSMEERAQVAHVHPRLARWVGPPCFVRKELVRPYCTEGAHYCGVPVWKHFPEVTRSL